MGYSLNHKGYRCLDFSTGRVYLSRHVIFDENSFPFREKEIFPLTHNSPLTSSTNFNMDSFCLLQSSRLKFSQSSPCQLNSIPFSSPTVLVPDHASQRSLSVSSPVLSISNHASPPPHQLPLSPLLISTTTHPRQLLSDPSYPSPSLASRLKTLSPLLCPHHTNLLLNSVSITSDYRDTTISIGLSIFSHFCPLY